MQAHPRCPICQSDSTAVLKTHTYAPAPAHLLPEGQLPGQWSAQDERLWVFFNKIARTSEPAQVHIRECRNCGFLYSDPRMDERDIQAKYETLTALGYDQIRHSNSPAKKRAERQQRVLELFSGLKDKQERPQRVLDYGGAEGHLLVPFVEQGQEGYLLDFIQYPQSDSRIQYLGKDLSALDEDQQFDYILLLHTLEHVVDPVGLIRDLKKHLAPDGLLYIEVPLGAWLEWEFLREPVTHLNFFSEQSLFQAVKEAGLDVALLQSNWQWVTHSQEACINIVGKNGKVPAEPPYRNTRQQRQSFHALQGALKANARYYGKQMVKSALGLA